MRTEVEQKLYELLLDVSERRGLEGVKILNFVIEECLKFYQKKYGTDFYEKIMRFVKIKGPLHSEIKSFPGAVRSLYYNMHANIYRRMELDDGHESMQESITYQVEEILLQDGVSVVDVLNIFETGMRRGKTEKLPAIYAVNEYVKRDNSDVVNYTTDL